MYGGGGRCGGGDRDIIPAAILISFSIYNFAHMLVMLLCPLQLLITTLHQPASPVRLEGLMVGTMLGTKTSLGLETLRTSICVEKRAETGR